MQKILWDSSYQGTDVPIPRLYCVYRKEWQAKEPDSSMQELVVVVLFFPTR